jgi:hypothetical protein
MFWRHGVEHSPNAYLVYDGGPVFRNDEPVTRSQRLAEGDVIRTADASATVRIHDSVILMLEPQSSVTLTDLSKTFPQATPTGSVSAIFTQANDVERFAMIKGDTVFEATGTWFTVEEMRTFVKTGKVLVRRGTEETILTKEAYLVRNDWGGWDVYPYTDGELAMLRSSTKNAIKEVRRLREEKIVAYPEALAVIRALTGLSNDELRTQLESYDTKTATELDALIKQAPIRPLWTRAVYAYTLEIQALNQVGK